MLNPAPATLAQEYEPASGVENEVPAEPAAALPEQADSFAFAVAVDMRDFAGPGSYDTPAYFRGAAEAIRAVGGADFMVSPGDIDPPAKVRWTMDQVLGADFLWYPAAGNHEAEKTENMDWLRTHDYDANGAAIAPNIVRWGPPSCPTTTYSFDYENAHFAVLNEFCDASGDTVADGDVPDYLYDWLAEDLSTTTKQHIFVVGHEPAFVQPDADNGRLRHVGDALDQHPANRDRFWSLLKSRGVRAYFVGHTHNYSAVQVDGVWQIDAGHARGEGDTGTPSTFVMIRVEGDTVAFETYRETFDGSYDYDDIVHQGVIAAPPPPPAPATH